jgi:hypothetical protein
VELAAGEVPLEHGFTVFFEILQVLPASHYSTIAQ